MIISTYNITFDFQVGDSKLVVPLTAEVELHYSATYYVIKKIRTGSGRKETVLPDFTIKKKNGLWVHVDSEKETDLSMQIGKVIERHENESEHTENT